MSPRSCYQLSHQCDLNREELLEYCHFLLDMNIQQMTYDMDQWVFFAQNIKPLLHHTKREVNLLGLIDFLKSEDPTNNIIETISNVLHRKDYIFNQNESKKLLNY